MASKFKKYFFLASWRLGAGLAVLWLMASAPAMAKPRVVLDAAHGGNDPGVKFKSEVEKDWNYKIAQALQKAFEGAGFEVVMIRKGDSVITPEKRIELINTSQASAVIILHVDREWTGAQRGPYLVAEPPTRPEAGDSLEIQKWGFVSPALYHSSLKLARAIGQKLGVNTEFSNLSDTRGLAGEPTSPEGKVFCLPHQSLRFLTLPSVVLTPLFLSSTSDIKKYSSSGNLTDFSDKVVSATSEFLQISQ